MFEKSTLWVLIFMCIFTAILICILQVFLFASVAEKLLEIAAIALVAIISNQRS